ncbi:hypothetical protein BDR26DRAFT_965137 [Obelidium mucronatum]|nr:hypothetical protein BDR26DRAFT_965137 [Obelidium mucronatum]
MRRSSRNAGKTVIYTVHDSDSDKAIDNQPTQPPLPAPLVPKIEFKEDNDHLNATSIPASSSPMNDCVKFESMETKEGIDSEHDEDDDASDGASNVNSKDSHDNAFALETPSEALNSFHVKQLAAIMENATSKAINNELIDDDMDDFIAEDMEDVIGHPIDSAPGGSVDLNFRKLQDPVYNSGPLNSGVKFGGPLQSSLPGGTLRKIGRIIEPDAAVSGTATNTKPKLSSVRVRTTRRTTRRYMELDDAGYSDDWDDVDDFGSSSRNKIKRESYTDDLETPPSTAKKPRKLYKVAQQEGATDSPPATALGPKAEQAGSKAKAKRGGKGKGTSGTAGHQVYFPKAPPFHPPPPPFIPEPNVTQAPPLPPSIAANPPRQFTPEMERELRRLPILAARYNALQKALALDGWVGEPDSIARYDGVITGSDVWSNPSTNARHMMTIHRIFTHTNYATRDPDSLYGRQDASWLLMRWHQEQQVNFQACTLDYQAKLQNSRQPENKDKEKCFCGICLE